MAEKKLRPGGLIEFYNEFKENHAYYVDKTMFIAQVLTNTSKVQLYTRPRRFGKTLSLTTLHTFLSFHDYLGRPFDPKPYFEGRNVMDCDDEVLSHMGKHPVIFMSLKECCKPTFEESLAHYRYVIKNVIRTHYNSLKQATLSEFDQADLGEMASQNCSRIVCENSLALLSRWIEQAAGVKPYILIDEYDVPLQSAYHYGYYDEMVSFIRSLFSNGLKTNSSFEKAVLTGCMRVSKESIFTGFNNLRVYSIDSEMDNEYFGFTPEEVKEMLAYYSLSEHYDAIQDWYDSYQFGTRHVYNPFSLVQCVDNLTLNDPRAIRCYWTNSSSNDVIRDMVVDHPECRDDIEKFLKGESIYKPIHESMTYRDMNSYAENIWTLLYFTGYVKSLSRRQIGDKWIHELKLVNKEIHAIFPQFIDILFYESVKKQDLSAFYQSIWDKNADCIKQFINNILAVMVSYYDTQEMFYHGMMLGILSNLYQYEIKSNREDGDGRTDIVLRDDNARRAVVFEFKWCNDMDEIETLPAAALQQVRDNKYAEAIHKEGYKTVYAVGVGFCKKTCDVAIEEM